MRGEKITDGKAFRGKIYKPQMQGVEYDSSISKFRFLRVPASPREFDLMLDMGKA